MSTFNLKLPDIIHKCDLKYFYYHHVSQVLNNKQKIDFRALFCQVKGQFDLIRSIMGGLEV